jgi:PAS domain S-box-containing protein
MNLLLNDISLCILTILGEDSSLLGELCVLGDFFMSTNQPSPDQLTRLRTELPYSSDHLSQQQAVIQITQRALLSSNFHQLMLDSIELVRTILNVDFGEVFQVNPEQTQLTLKAIAGWPVEFQQTLQMVRNIEPGSIYEYVLNNLQPVFSNDLNIEQRFKLPEIYRLPKVHSCIITVIKGKEQHYGIFSVFSSTPRNFSSIEINFIQKIANLLAVVIDRQQIESSLITSRDELAFILGGIAEGIMVQVGGGKLIYANDMAARLLGFKDRKDFLSTPIQKVMSGIQIYYENGEVMPDDQFPGGRVLNGEEKVSVIVRIHLKESGVDRWLLINSGAVTDTFKQERMAVNIFQDITAIKQDKSDQKFLADISDMLARSVTFEKVLNNIAVMTIQHFADWCIVHMVEDEGEVIQSAVAHKDQKKIAMTMDLQNKYPPDKSSTFGVYEVIKSGQEQFFPEITDTMMKTIAQDDYHYQILNELGLHSAMILPMIVHGHTLGTLTLVWADSKQKFNEREMNLGRELAQRAALAIDNVRLFQQSLTLNVELENKVLKRTNQLEQTNAKLVAEIAERIQIQQDLETSRALFSDLFELSPDAIFLVEHNGNIHRVNSQAAAIFGYQKQELLGQKIEQLIPDKNKTVHVENRKKFYSKSQLRVMGEGFELYGLTKSGEQFPVDVMLSPVRIGDDLMVISVVRDITEQKNIQAELAEVQHRLLDSKEAERLMLAHELHDGNIQELFSVNFQLAEIGNDAKQAGMEGLVDKVKDVSETTQKVIQGLRNISRDLRPPALTPFGVEQAIYSHLERFQDLHSDIELNTEITPDGQRLDERMRLILFRIYQNAVSNVARHSNADQLWVRFDLTDTRVTLEIEDNGKGFIIPERWIELVRQGHLGLVSIRERVEAIGGKLTIISEPGKGTLIRVDAPIE